MARQKLADVDVVYYHEGVNETVSVTRSKGGEQSFIVNGRPEASTALIDVQLQRALGHVPMLLHPNPRRVFVLGTGSGMTLGATSIHPEVERVVLAEIEDGVLGVARSFAAWNSDVLDNPKLHVVLNDGRNFLATTRDGLLLGLPRPALLLHHLDPGARGEPSAEAAESLARGHERPSPRSMEPPGRFSPTAGQQEVADLGPQTRPAGTEVNGRDQEARVTPPGRPEGCVAHGCSRRPGRLRGVCTSRVDLTQVKGRRIVMLSPSVRLPRRT